MSSSEGHQPLAGWVIVYQNGIRKRTLDNGRWSSIGRSGRRNVGCGYPSLAVRSGGVLELRAMYTENFFAMGRPDDGVHCSVESEGLLGFDRIMVEPFGVPYFDHTFGSDASRSEKLRVPATPRKSLRKVSYRASEQLEKHTPSQERDA